MKVVEKNMDTNSIYIFSSPVLTIEFKKKLLPTTLLILLR